MALYSLQKILKQETCHLHPRFKKRDKYDMNIMVTKLIIFNIRKEKLLLKVVANGMVRVIELMTIRVQ